MLQIVNMTVIAKHAVLRSKVEYICHLEETFIKTLERNPAYTDILLLISFIVNESFGDRQITQEDGGRSVLPLSFCLYLFYLCNW